MFGEQFQPARLDDKKLESYERNIIESGTPSKEELVQELKNFFEGPINLDLMILGSLKSLGLQNGELPSPEVRK